MATGFFIRASDRLYYEGDQQHVLDQVVPQRPGLTYVAQFDGNGLFTAWVVDANLAAFAARMASDAADTLAFLSDPNLMSLLDMTAQNISDTIDAAFPALTVQQRTILKRIAQVAQLGARLGVRVKGGV